MLINKTVLSEKTIFEFSLLDYTQTDKNKVNVGCGNLVYKPHFLSGEVGVQLVKL